MNYPLNYCSGTNYPINYETGHSKLWIIQTIQITHLSTVLGDFDLSRYTWQSYQTKHWPTCHASSSFSPLLWSIPPPPHDLWWDQTCCHSHRGAHDIPVSQGKPKDREDLDPSPSFHLSPHDHMQPSIQPGNLTSWTLQEQARKWPRQRWQRTWTYQRWSNPKWHLPLLARSCPWGMGGATSSGSTTPPHDTATTRQGWCRWACSTRAMQAGASSLCPSPPQRGGQQHRQPSSSIIHHTPQGHQWCLHCVLSLDHHRCLSL